MFTSTRTPREAHESDSHKQLYHWISQKMKCDLDFSKIVNKDRLCCAFLRQILAVYVLYESAGRSEWFAWFYCCFGIRRRTWRLSTWVRSRRPVSTSPGSLCCIPPVPSTDALPPPTFFRSREKFWYLLTYFPTSVLFTAGLCRGRLCLTSTSVDW